MYILNFSLQENKSKNEDTGLLIGDYLFLPYDQNQGNRSLR